jgi:hypothetical protein
LTGGDTIPRAKKLPGTAVDSRNGQQAALPAEPLPRFSLPRRGDGQKWDLRTQRMWRALWDDDRLAAALSPVDRELVLRWAESVDDAVKARARAWESPIAKGSMGQDVESPYFGIAAKAVAVAEKCEAQIGIGALNRARLGIAILTEAKTLADLSAGYPGDAAGEGRYADPR